jgi:hypothetical protein
MNKRVDVPLCTFSKVSIHTVFYEQRRSTYNELGGLVEGAQQAFAQGSINGWADPDWHIQLEKQQRLETQLT